MAESSSSSSVSPGDKVTKFCYQLRQTWTPTLKYKKPMPKGNNFCYWVLHGLWLTNNIGKYKGATVAEYCEPDTYKDYNAEIELDGECKRQLNIIWPNVDQAFSDTVYHQHQLMKHGHAAIVHTKNFTENAIKDPKQYLCKAASLAAEFNVGKYLKNVNIGEKHKLKHLIEDINNYKLFGKRPYIKLFSPNGPEGEHYLDEIVLYFDSNFKKMDALQKNVNLETMIIYPKCGNYMNAIDPPETERQPCDDDTERDTLDNCDQDICSTEEDDQKKSGKGAKKKSNKNKNRKDRWYQGGNRGGYQGGNRGGYKNKLY